MTILYLLLATFKQKQSIQGRGQQIRTLEAAGDDLYQ